MTIDPEYEKKIKEAKLSMRRELVKLPFEEKIRRIVEMQKFSREFKKDKSKEVFVWGLD